MAHKYQKVGSIKPDLKVVDMNIAGREGLVTFEKEGSEWWEIWTLPGFGKGKRMWLEPSKLSASAEANGPWILSADKLTPAFEHPVNDTELALEGGGRSRRSRKSTGGGPSARNSVEPPPPPPPKAAPSKPAPPKKNSSSEATTSRRTSTRRSQSATVSVPVSPLKVKKEVVPSNAAAGPSRRRSTRAGPEPEIEIEAKSEEPGPVASSFFVDEPEDLVVEQESAADVLAPPPPPPIDAGPRSPPPLPMEPPSQPASPPTKSQIPPPAVNQPSPPSILDPPPREPSPPAPDVDAPAQPSPPPLAPPIESSPSPAFEAPSTSLAAAGPSAQLPPSPSAVTDENEDPVPAADAAPSVNDLEVPSAPEVSAPRPEEPLPELSASPKEVSPEPITSPLPKVETVVDLAQPEPLSSTAEAASSSSFVEVPSREEVKAETIAALPEAPPVEKEEGHRIVAPPRSTNPFALGPSSSSSSSASKGGTLAESEAPVEVVNKVGEEKEVVIEERVEPDLKTEELVEESKTLVVEQNDVATPSSTSDLLPVASQASPLPPSSLFTSTTPLIIQPEPQASISKSHTLNQDLPTPKAANPFGRLIPSSIPDATTPLVLDDASLLSSVGAPSPSRNLFGETAIASPALKEEVSTGIPEGSSSSSSTKIEAMEVDPGPLAASSLPLKDAFKPLPSFKRKGGPSAAASQPKKAKASPTSTSTEEPPAETKEVGGATRGEREPRIQTTKEETVKIEDEPRSQWKGTGEEKEAQEVEPARVDAVRKERATHPEPAIAFQPSIPSWKGKERAAPESEDSDDMEEIKTSPKPKSNAPSKRKEPEPSSSPLTEQEDDSPAKPSRTVTSELVNPSAVKKAKTSFKSKKANRVESSEEESGGSSPSSSSSEEEEEVPKKKKMPTSKSLLNLTNVSKSFLPPSSISTPTMASPAPPASSSSRPVASSSSSSSTPKLAKATSTSTSSTGVPSKASGYSSQLLPKKSFLKPNDGTSRPKDRPKAGSSGTSTLSSSKPKPKPAVAKGAGWLTSLLPGDVLSPQASSSNLKLSADAKKNRAQEEEIARKKKAFLAEVDAENAHPLDIEAQANVMEHFEKWQQTNLHRDNWLFPSSNGRGWADAAEFRAKDARGEISNERIPRPRNAVEAEDLDFAWIASMEGNWGDAAKVQAYLNDPKYFPRGPGVNW